jgi:hypothetical protein
MSRARGGGGVGGGVGGSVGGASLGVWALCWWGGSMYVGGRFAAAGSSTTSNSTWASWSTTGSTPGTPNIARWDGTAWQALDGGTNGMVRSVRLFQGALYVVGMFTTVGTTPITVNGVARWSGSGWSGVGSQSAGYGVTFIKMSWSSQACGSSSTSFGCTTGANNCDSTCAQGASPWTSACPCGWSWRPDLGGSMSVNDVTVDSAGRVYVVGFFTQAGGYSRAPLSTVTAAQHRIPWSGTVVSNAAYWDPGVGAWLDMNRGFNDLMYCVQAFGNSVYAGGQPNRYSDTTMWGITTGPGATALVSTLHRWVIGGSAWQQVGNLQSGSGNDVRVLRASSTLLYIGGIFQYTGGTFVTGGAYLAAYSGTAFTSFGTSTTQAYSNINAIALHGSELYVGTGPLFGSMWFTPGIVWRFGAAPVPCSGGRFISFTTGACELCPAGSFGTGEWPCPTGSTCLTGTTCTGCPAGSGSTAIGQVRVLRIPAGR